MAMETLVNILSEIENVAYTKEETDGKLNANKIHYVVGNQNTETNLWTGPANSLGSVVKGTIIIYYLPKNSLANTNVQLNLTLQGGSETGFIDVSFANGQNVQDYYKAKDLILLMYVNKWIVVDTKKTDIIVDNELDSTSNNPLANTGVYDALSDLREEIMEQINMDRYNIQITSPSITDVDNAIAEVNKGLVQFTAKITDGNNANAEGVLIKFEKENGELIGMGVSNPAGNATVFQRQKEDIYRLVSSVANTSYAKRQQIYVNEPNNLVEKNVWSGTELKHSINGFSRKSNVTIVSSTDWSSIGNYSLKINRVGDSNFHVYTDTNQFTGYTIIRATIDILTKDTATVFRLATIDPNNLTPIQKDILLDTTIPASDEMQTVTVSAMIPSGDSMVRLIFLSQTKNAPVYVDNIRVVGVSGETMFWDTGVTGTGTTWYTNDNGSLTVTDNGTVLSNANGTDIALIYANKYGTDTSTYSDYVAPFNIEFDIVDKTDNGNNKPFLRFHSGETDRDINITETGHYKLYYNGSRLSTWINDTQKPNVDFTLSDAIRLGFGVNNGVSLTFKNFRIYKIE